MTPTLLAGSSFGVLTLLVLAVAALTPQIADRQWWKHRSLTGGAPPNAIYIDELKDGMHRIQMVYAKGQVASWYARRVPRWVKQLKDAKKW